MKSAPCFARRSRTATWSIRSTACRKVTGGREKDDHVKRISGRLLLMGVVAQCLALSGCGTFSDIMCGPIDDHVYYRGVRLDVEAVKEGGPLAILAADIPLSAAAD